MFKKNYFIRSLQRLFDFLPTRARCVFGNCKSACTALSVEDDLNRIQSLKIKLHLAICSDCSNYYNQMVLIDSEICKHLRKKQQQSVLPPVKLREKIEEVVSKSIS